MMNGLMMHRDLTITSIMRHAQLVCADQEIVTLKADGTSMHRYRYKDAFARVAQCAHALDQLAVSKNAKVATMAWNTYQHFELHYAIPCSGRIYHTINPKLSSEQILQIIQDAKDEVLLVEQDCLHIVAQIFDQIKATLRHIIVLGDSNPDLTAPFDFIFYEQLLLGQPSEYPWPEIQEQSASGLCYTSGTTGQPKGVLSSHRSTVLHALILSMSDVIGLNHKSCIMPLVPLYHISAWGMPFNAALCGAKLVWANSFAGDTQKIATLIENEQVDISLAVPTIWSAFKDYLQQYNIQHTSLKRAISGGSAAPYSLIQALAQYGIAVENGWGMTETSSMATLNRADQLDENSEGQAIKCGKPIFGVEMRLVDISGQQILHDGRQEGVLEIRGHSVAKAYVNVALEGESATDSTAQENTWFDTGDIACIDEQGYMHITDRAKDMIKTGGEWVSSVEVENAAMGYHKIAEAAVIGAAHPKWGERPVLIVVAKNGVGHIEHSDVVEYLAARLHKWAIPSATILVDEIPHTPTGKVSKKTLRERYQDYFLRDQIA